MLNLHVFEARSFSVLRNLRELPGPFGVSDLGPHFRTHRRILAQIVEHRAERDCQYVVSSDTTSQYEPHSRINRRVWLVRTG